jgi:hypothetical protein
MTTKIDRKARVVLLGAKRMFSDHMAVPLDQPLIAYSDKQGASSEKKH